MARTKWSVPLLTLYRVSFIFTLSSYKTESDSRMSDEDAMDSERHQGGAHQCGHLFRLVFCPNRGLLLQRRLGGKAPATNWPTDMQRLCSTEMLIRRTTSVRLTERRPGIRVYGPGRTLAAWHSPPLPSTDMAANQRTSRSRLGAFVSSS